jgi:arylformamidase
MSFDNMPFHGKMFMPGVDDYAAECIRLAKAAVPGHRVVMDVSYGEDPLQQLDLWMPPRPSDKPLPVIVFLHGGAMRNGFKEWIGSQAPAFCALPAILVSPNYRLVPKVRNEAAIGDCFDALAWVHRHIAEYGGDPRRIFVGGHSAGAYLAALMTLRKGDLAKRGIPAAAIRGCLSVSGIFTYEKKDFLPEEGIRARLWHENVESEADAVAVTAYNHVAGNTVPFLIGYGSAEPPEIIHDNKRMIALAESGGFLREAQIFPGCDHFAAHLQCTNAAGRWMRSVAEFVAETA